MGIEKGLVEKPTKKKKRNHGIKSTPARGMGVRLDDLPDFVPYDLEPDLPDFNPFDYETFKKFEETRLKAEAAFKGYF